MQCKGLQHSQRMDKVKSFVFPNSSNQDDGVAWWMKYAAKAAGILGGIGE